MAPAYNPVLEILKRNWFQMVSAEQPRRWTFEEDIRSGGADVALAVLDLYRAFLREELSEFDADGIAHLLEGGNISVGNDVLGLFDLARFLEGLTLSEYRLDSLSWGSRGSEFRTYAAQIGWPADRLHDLHEWWSSSGRRLARSYAIQGRA